MKFVQSRDGTRIAVESSGDGPPIALVAGAFNDRHAGAALAGALSARFTVVRYDRRGRGDSADTPPYAVEREIEDLAAVLGGRGSVLGYSSGAILALRAAAAGVPIDRLALYDLPLRLGGAPGPDHARALAASIDAGDRGAAVEYYQQRVVGLPAERVVALRGAPFRRALEAIAHTLVHDATLLGDGRLGLEIAASVRPPTLVAAGAWAPWMGRTAEALAAALPEGQAAIVEGATHDLDPSLLAPVFARFFAGDPGQ